MLVLDSNDYMDLDPNPSMDCYSIADMKTDVVWFVIRYMIFHETITSSHRHACVCIPV